MLKLRPGCNLNPDNWVWSAPGGWRPKSFKEFNLGSMENPHVMGMKWGWFSAYQRNQQAFEALNERVGQMDVDAMIDIYRISGSIPQGDWKEIAKAYTEEQWQPAVGNASNALVVIMKPEDGVYMHCIGEVKRGLAPMSAKNSSPLYDETNAFWEINLTGTLADMLHHAGSCAKFNIQQALAGLHQASLNEKALTRLNDLYSERTTRA